MSNLLKMSLAAEDTQLQRRLRAALVQHANQLKHRDVGLALKSGHLR